MRALITGVAGFTGRYLAQELATAGYKVYGLAHKELDEEIAGVSKVFVSDLSDKERLSEVIASVKPNVVFHLAAIAFVAHGNVDAIYQTNVIGTRNLLGALEAFSADLKAVLLASSANVYGNATPGVIDESAVLAPVNDYAVSKVAMEYVARLFEDKLPIIIARPFNYTGAGQSESFLLPKIVNHVRSKKAVIELGNLDVSRDFSDVRMVAHAYRLLAEHKDAVGQIFNVCSGEAYSLNDVLNMVRSISVHDIEVRVNPAFVRANEVKVLLGSRQKLDALIGQVQAIPLRETLQTMLEAAQ